MKKLEITYFPEKYTIEYYPDPPCPMMEIIEKLYASIEDNITKDTNFIYCFFRNGPLSKEQLYNKKKLLRIFLEELIKIKKYFKSVKELYSNSMQAIADHNSAEISRQLNIQTTPVYIMEHNKSQVNNLSENAAILHLLDSLNVNMEAALTAAIDESATLLAKKVYPDGNFFELSGVNCTGMDKNLTQEDFKKNLLTNPANTPQSTGTKWHKLLFELKQILVAHRIILERAYDLTLPPMTEREKFTTWPLSEIFINDISIEDGRIAKLASYPSVNFEASPFESRFSI